MNKRLWIVLGIVTALVVIGWWVFANQSGGSATVSGPAAEGTVTAPDVPDNVIWASGTLRPVTWAALSPATGGTVQTVHVAEGDMVQAGDVLIDLDNGVLRSQVDAAAAALAEAEAARDKVLAGATVAQLAAARADLASAQAGQAQAKAALDQARDGAAAANAQVAIAQAQYNELASRPTAAQRIAAQKEVERARALLDQAQAAYDQVRGDPNIGALPQAVALQQATATYEAAVAAADVALQRATPQQLAVAQAQINAARAQAQVAQAQVPAAEAAIQSAQAAVQRAQAALDDVQDGASKEEKAMAEARVQSARAALATAQAQLDQARIVAPFAGQVGSLVTRPGELAVAGQPLLTIGNTAAMRVETTDLRETDVTRVRTGMPVEVTFDALPGQAFQGTVSRIAPMSTVDKGSTNYTLIVEVPELDPNLRWGMTAFVNIQAQ
jgi:HlyD family secretion protein